MTTLNVTSLYSPTFHSQTSPRKTNLNESIAPQPYTKKMDVLSKPSVQNFSAIYISNPQFAGARRKPEERLLEKLDELSQLSSRSTDAEKAERVTRELIAALAKIKLPILDQENSTGQDEQLHFFVDVPGKNYRFRIGQVIIFPPLFEGLSHFLSICEIGESGERELYHSQTQLGAEIPPDEVLTTLRQFQVAVDSLLPKLSAADKRYLDQHKD